MLYPILAGVIVFLAVVLAFYALRMLFRRNWLLGWLRGMAGLLLVVIAVLLAFIALDLNHYRQLQAEQAIATLSFEKQGDQYYQVTVVDADGNEQQFELMGDLWQLDARLLKWHDSLSRLGFSTGYRLDRLSGRYLSLQDEQQRPRTVHALDNPSELIDSWLWLRQYGRSLGLLDADYGSATYLPMTDGALFAVNLGNTGLIARPLNRPATDVVQGWQ